MAEPKVWTFTQLGGDQDMLRLDGWQAPFGRPRHATIVNAGLGIRRSVTYYPGNQSPTVHAFGTMHKPFELHGRWMDAAMALRDGAKTYARSWKDFIGAQQKVRAKWGNILSYVIFIHDIDLEFEGEADVAWKLQADVIQDDGATVDPTPPVVKAPFDIALAMFTEINSIAPFAPSTSLLGKYRNLLALLPDVADTIDATVSAINTPFQLVYDTASALSDFETALSSDLVKLGSGMQQVHDSLSLLQDSNELLLSRAASMNDLAHSNAAYFGDLTGITSGATFSATESISMRTDKIAADRAAINLASLIADMQNAIDRTVRGRPIRAYVAQEGDTWELIASRLMGAADGARAIKSMNGIQRGQKPIAGKSYTIPQAG